MEHLLSVAKAARLAGVKRNELQLKIRRGELVSFDGMVRKEALLQVYPDLNLEDDAELERVNRIKTHAFAKRVLERVLPEAPVLANRINVMAEELMELRAELHQREQILVDLDMLLIQMMEDLPVDVHQHFVRLQGWLASRKDQAVDVEAVHRIGSSTEVYRPLATHIRLQPSDHEFLIEGRETLLAAALRAGLAPQYGCSNGNCGMCKARVVSGKVHQVKRHDFVIGEAEKNMGHMLMCCNTAVTDLVIEAQEDDAPSKIPQQRIQARIRRITQPIDSVMILDVRTPRHQRLRFLPGQEAIIELGNGIRQTFPIASCPCEELLLQFHVPVQDDDLFSQALQEHAEHNQTLTIEGPVGEFTFHDDRQRAHLFIACDTGFAAIKGLMEHVMAREISDPLHFYWLAGTEGGHYQDNLCRSWDDALDNFRYTPLIVKGDNYNALLQLVKDHPNIADYEVYVAGSNDCVAPIVRLLKGLGMPPEYCTALVLGQEKISES